jgi:hypothetical protein
VKAEEILGEVIDALTELGGGPWVHLCQAGMEGACAGCMRDQCRSLAHTARLELDKVRLGVVRP